MLLFLLLLEDSYGSDYYCAVEIEKKINILDPKNLQFKNRTEAIGAVGMTMLVS